MRHHSAALSCALAAVLASGAWAQTSSRQSLRQAEDAPQPPVTFDAIAPRFAAQHSDLVKIEPIGRTGKGRVIHALRLAADGPVAPDDRPALVIVAGLSGSHIVGSRTAMSVAEALVADHADALRDHTVYVIPAVNQDCLAMHLLGEGPKSDFSRTFTPDDADRDGRIDEDSPADINHDGMITLMRLKNPPPGIAATYTLDPEDERVMKKPDAALGESADYALFVEGVDQDGDGQIAEDAVGGVELDMNFMHLYPEHADGAGKYQLCEPESLALVNWFLEHNNIVSVLVFGPHDTLVKIPEAGATDETGEAPKGILEDDKKQYEAVSKAFKEITKMKEAPERDSAGAFHAWAYAQFGAWSFATPVWVRPDQIEGGEPDEDAKDSDDAAAQKEEKPKSPLEGLLPEGWPTDPAALRAQFEGASDAERAELIAAFRALPPGTQAKVMQAMRGMAEEEQTKKKGGGAASDPDAAKWLKYIEKHRDGVGFVEWTTFDHPTLGEVEIGGFVPGVKINPPDDELPRLAEEQTKFALDLLSRFPSVSIDEPIVERLAPGLYHVTLRVRNDGKWPTTTAMAGKLRRIPATVVRLDTPRESILSGPRVARVGAIDGGAYHELEWTITAADGATITANLTNPTLGDSSIDITLPN